MRRPLLLLGVLAAACGLGWHWTHPADLRIAVDPRSREIALLFPAEAKGLRTAAVVSRALGEFAGPEKRGESRERIAREFARGGERIAVGFLPDQPAEVRAADVEAETGGKILPGIARMQLRGVPHGYLLLHAAPAAALLETAGRRRWLGRALVEAGAQAETATIAVGESDDGAFLVATVAFAYRTGDEAEAALARLTAKQGDFEALGFAARPGTDRLTRQTKLLVIRFDIETDLVLQALGRR
jgi:hypothetical protein